MAGGDSEGAKGGGGGLIGFVIVTVLALALGGGFGMFMDSMPATAEADSHKEQSAKDEHAEAAPLLSGSKVVPLTPIVVNLGAPANSWIRIEASVLVGGMVEGSDALAAQVAEDFVAYLRTATLDQFEGPSGFQNLREDLLDRATIRDHEYIKDVIIHGVVVE